MSRLKAKVEQIIKVLRVQKESQLPKAFFDAQPCGIASNTFNPNIQYVEVQVPSNQQDRFVMYTLHPSIQLVFSLSELNRRITSGDYTNPAFFGTSAQLLGIRPRFTDLQVQRIQQEQQCRVNLSGVDEFTKQLSMVLTAPILRYFVLRFPKETSDWIGNRRPYWYVNIDVVPDEAILAAITSSEPTMVQWIFRIIQSLQFFTCVWFLPNRVQNQPTSKSKQDKIAQCKDTRCVWEKVWQSFDYKWMELGFEAIFLPFLQIQRDFGPRVPWAVANIKSMEDTFIQLYPELSQHMLEFIYGLFKELVANDTLALLLEVDGVMTQSQLSLEQKKQRLLHFKDHKNQHFVALLQWIISETHRLVLFYTTPTMTCLPPDLQEK